jgi:predicted HTH transcriptional regulator
MTKEEALKLIESGESQNTEFKTSLSEINDAIKTLVAFGSQTEGGILLFGIKDDGTSQELCIGKETIEKLANDIKINTLSMITSKPLHPEIYVYKNPNLLAVVVGEKEAKNGPFLAFNKAYSRIGKSTHEVKIDYRSLAKAYKENLINDAGNSLDEPPSYNFCPECGHVEFRKETYSFRHGTSVVIFCNKCDWSSYRSSR